MAVGQKLALRCFLEGIEVPIIAASLTINMDAPAQCQVQLPATDAILELKPRTLVHIFYYDYLGGPGDSITAGVNTPSEEGVSTVRESDRQETPDTYAGADPSGVGLNSDNLSSSLMASPSVDSTGTAEAGENAVVSANAQPQAAGPIQAGGPDGEAADMPPELADSENWKIYFIGEVTAIQFQKSAMQRSIILNCMDNSIYWDTCYQYSANSSANLTGNGQANFVGGGTTMFDTFWEEGTSTIVNVVKSQPVSQPDLTGLLAGVVALLERVGGVYRRGSQNFAGVNDFFTIAELRLKLVYQITAASEDFSSQHVFSRRAFHFWGRRQAGRLGKISSFREIVNLMNKFIFHNIVPNPICLYEPPHTEERTRVRTGTIDLSETDQGQAVIQRIEQRRRAIAGFRNPQLMRVGTNSSRIIGLLNNSLRDLDGIAADLRRLHASGASAQVISAKTGISSAIHLLRLLGGDLTERGIELVRSGTGQAQSDLDSALAIFSGISRSFRRESTSTHHLGNRLNSQIVRPDVYFVAPPRCNVLFPELYSQVSYQRAYMQEVTRMRLTVSDEIFGEDALLNNCYYAPDVAVVGSNARRQSQLGRRRDRANQDNSDRTLDHAAYSRRLMDHELYTGIVPMFERMNEVNIYGNRTDSVTVRGARIPYVDRAVNHQFFKHRFAPRTISVSGKFNPSAACGFPALVLDKHMNAESTRLVTQGFFSQDFFEHLWAAGRNDAAAMASGEQEENTIGDQDELLAEAWDTLRRVTPTQYLGLVSSMTHNVSQNQGATTYSMSSARTHNENEELLGANNVRVAVRAPGRSPTRRTVVAATSEPQTGQTGPYHGIITEVEAVEGPGQYLLYGTYSGSRPRRQQTRVSVGVTQTARAHGPEVTVLVGDPDAQVTFSAYRVTERIDRWSGTTVDVPLEDFIRPPWMSDIWRNDRIGSVYHQFFGTGAITDPITVGGVPDTSVSDEQANQDETAAARRDIPLRPLPAELAEDDPDFGPGVSVMSDEQLTGTGADEVGEAQAPSQGDTIQSSLTGISVERAVNLLTRVYSSIKHNGSDTHEFIRAYNWRPVATLTEILGSYDLEFNAQGEVEHGSEGFHSRAFGRGPMGRDLKNLIPSISGGEDEEGSNRSLLGIDPDNDRDNVLTRLDKRDEKAQVVLRYVTELWDSKGLLG